MTDNTYSLNRLTRSRSTLTFTSLPKTTYMMTDWNLPALELPPASQSSPFFDKPLYGDKLEYSPLEIEFAVTEYLDEWLELHDWMYYLANPSEKTTIPLDYVQGIMLLYTSHHNPFLEITFEDIVPVYLGGLQFTEGENQTSEIKSNASFRYQKYTIKRLGNV